MFSMCVVAALLLGSCNCQKEKEIVIVSVNDIHASIDRFPIFAAVVDSLRQVHPDLLLFSAGDNRTGNPINDQYSPHVNQPIIDLMNEVGFNLSCLGNHEFDANIPALKYTIDNSIFPYICANAYFDTDCGINTKPYCFIKNKGVKIGILGLIQVEETGFPSAHPKNLAKVKFRKPEEVITEYKSLRDKCDLFVVLSHCGYETDRILADTFPEPDLIVGGHSHTLVAEPKDVNGVLITQSGSHLKYLTVTKIKMKGKEILSKTAEVIDLRERTKENAKVRQMVDGFNNSEAMKEVIGQAEKPFSNREELGSLMCDAIRYEMDADIAIQNPGGVRVSNWNTGEITKKNLFELDPFGNEVVRYELTGRQVVELLKNTIRSDKGPCHVSGIRYNVKLNEDFTVADIEVYKDAIAPKYPPFDLDRTYVVVMNSYISSTTHFSGEETGETLPITCAELTIKYIEKHSPLNYEGVRRVFVEIPEQNQ